MPIECKICKRQFSKQITNSHLKTHAITTTDYKTQFGKDALSSEEYRQMIAVRNTGKNNPNFGKAMKEQSKDAIRRAKVGKAPWNKGKKVLDTSPHKEAAAGREARYLSGDLVRHTGSPTSDTKEKISLGVKKYAEAHHDELSRRAKKAIVTRIENGYDLAFFKGQKHTPASKAVMADAVKKANEKRSIVMEKHRRTLVEQAGLRLIGTNNTLMTLECKTCGCEFTRTRQAFTETKFRKDQCRQCFPISTLRSQKERELFDFVKEHCSDAIASYKYSNSKRELDIFIPSINIGIEFNGLYWHSETVLLGTNRNKTYDFEKMNEAHACGIRSIIIMEDEWDNKKEIVKARLLHLFGLSSVRVFARKCKVREITSHTASRFCSEFHIQGKGRSNARFGLFYNDELLAVMTFSKDNLSRKISCWELNRFCSLPNTNIIGGASKLLRAFEENYLPKTLLTYADRRWSLGEVYEKMGFSFHGNTSPGYWYFLPNEGIRIHRFSLRKNKNDNQLLTEYENRLKQGYLRIWDCGHKKYIKTYP